MTLRQTVSAALITLQLAGCAWDETDGPATDKSTTAARSECGRVEAAARFSATPFAAMETMAEQCEKGEGVLFSCNPVSYGLTALTGVFFAPMGFAIGLGSEEVERHHCRSSG